MNTGSSGDGTFSRLRAQLPAIQDTLRELDLDGWLLYDLHARNTVSARTLEVGDLTRRYFVLVPRDGDPVALTHGIEQLPWLGWPWRKEVYVGWRSLEEMLQPLVGGKRVAMEISEGDAVPAMDLVPFGVIELVCAAGAKVVTSGDLVSRFYARWTDEDLASHRRASTVLANVANTALQRLASAVAAGSEPTEGSLRDWVLSDLAANGCGVGADCIPATGRNAANPHYGPVGNGATFRKGDVVLLDLWAKESEASVFSDQTWMGYLGADAPARTVEIFNAVRDARDEAVRLLKERWAARQPVEGREVDDAARGVIRDRGYGDYFIHRTGHSIDQSTHGMGPNIDNLETRETRTLIPGVAFSIEPGIYLTGELGVRSEINVFMGPDGPEVTTPNPQTALPALLPE